MSVPLQRTVVQTLAARAKALRPQQTARIDRAVELVLAGHVQPVRPDIYAVSSGTEAGLTYWVRVMPAGPWQCACPDQANRGGWCKHGLSAKLYERALALSPPQRTQPAGHKLREHVCI